MKDECIDGESDPRNDTAGEHSRKEIRQLHKFVAVEENQCDEKNDDRNQACDNTKGDHKSFKEIMNSPGRFVCAPVALEYPNESVEFKYENKATRTSNCAPTLPRNCLAFEPKSPAKPEENSETRAQLQYKYVVPK